MTVPTYRPDTDDATTRRTTASPGTTETGQDEACPVCPHPLSRHDPIGVRFCRATAAGAFHRGCVCRTD